MTSFRTSFDEGHRQALRMAYSWAVDSHDPSSQNGALIVEEQDEGFRCVAIGVNYVPGLKEDALERVLSDRNLKYPRVLHAEVAAIALAASRGRPVAGLTMVCPWAACLGCVGPILHAGIKRLVVHKQRFEAPYAAWNPGIVEAHDWLADSGVELVAYDGAIGEAPPIRVNYEIWQP